MDSNKIPKGFQKTLHVRKNSDGSWSATEETITALRSVAKAELGIDNPKISFEEVNRMIKVVME